MRCGYCVSGQPWMVLLLALAVLSGCSQGGTGTSESSAPAMGAVDTSAEAVEKAMAQLPEGDREAARTQKNCPVSEHALGSMGAPVKATVTVDGASHEVYLCCEGCREVLEKEPAKFVAKLPK